MTERDEDRFVHVLLEETAGDLHAPDLRQRVLARAGVGGPRRARAARGRWAAAALVALGLGVVGYAAWLGRGGGVEPHGGTDPGVTGPEAPADGATEAPDVQDPDVQDPEALGPGSIEAFQKLLRDVRSIRVHVVDAPPHGADVQGTPPTVFAAPQDVEKVVAGLQACGGLAPDAAGWAWPHRIELVLGSGAAVLCAVYPYDDWLGVQGLGDLQGTAANLAPLRELVERASAEARRARGIVYGADEFGPDATDPIPRDSETLELFNLSDADLEGIDWFEAVRVLDLGNCKGLTDAAMEAVARLETLEEIRFANSSITDAGLAKLASLPRLARLDLRYNGGRDANGPVFSGEGFAAFAGHGALRALDLTYCRGLTDAGLARVAALPALEQLDLSGRRTGQVTEAGLRALGGAARLRDLDLSDCPLDIDAAVEAWGGLGELRRLDVSDTSVGAEGLRHLLECHALERVEIDRCENLDGQALAFVTYLPELRVLHASRLPARGPDLVHLGTASKLEELSLDQTPITVDVASAIARCEGLRRLRLSFCSVDDACAAELARLPGLEELDLAGSRELTDAGLAELATMSTLRKLDLNVCRGITAEGVASLRETLPACELVLPDALRGSGRELSFEERRARRYPVTDVEIAQLELTSIRAQRRPILRRLSQVGSEIALRVTRTGLGGTPHVFTIGQTREYREATARLGRRNANGTYGIVLDGSFDLDGDGKSEYATAVVEVDLDDYPELANAVAEFERYVEMEQALKRRGAK